MTATLSGEEFRGDIRKRFPLEVLRPLTKLSAFRATLAICQTIFLLAAVVAVAALTWTPWTVIPAVVLIGALQHALFILVHDSAHYRLYEKRWLNDLVGRVLGMAGGISMRTYRVIHRLHHNHLYGPQDPDMALHAGYPRGQAYLMKKLAKDLLGLTAWKNYAYFFGNPAINDETSQASRPMNDTSAKLRSQARQDRWFVVALQVALPLIAYGYGFFLEYAILWLLPMITVLQAILRLRAICEHGAVSDISSPLKSARTNQANSLVRMLLFPHHVNYHLEHHLYPSVPHYNLPRLHMLLREHGMLEGAEIRSVTETLGLLLANRMGAVV